MLNTRLETTDIDFEKMHERDTSVTLYICTGKPVLTDTRDRRTLAHNGQIFNRTEFLLHKVFKIILYITDPVYYGQRTLFLYQMLINPFKKTWF